MSLACALVAALLALTPPSAASASALDRVAFTVETVKGSPVHASPVLQHDNASSSGDRLLFGTLEPACRLYSIDGRTGEVLWSYEAGSGDERCGLRTVPVVDLANGLLHSATDNNTFFALPLRSGGEPAWTLRRPSVVCTDTPVRLRACEIYSTALLLRGMRLQGSEDGHMRALEAATGKVLWDFTAGGMVNGAPVLVSETDIAFGSDDRNFYRMDATTGKVKAKLPHCGRMDTRPALNAKDGLVYFTCFRPDDNPGDHPNGTVYAVDVETWTEKWKIDGPTGVPLYVPEEDLVVIGDNTGAVFALEPATGKRVWTAKDLPTQAEFFGNFVYDKQRRLLYGGNLGKSIMAVQAADGKLAWSMQLDGLIASQEGSPISRDGKLLYVGTYAGTLYALKLD